jgi:hypothetical protein
MKAQTFIFVHDQYIVLDYLAAGKFNDLPNVKYVFLGQRPSDQIGHLVDMGKVIIARDLPDNIEHLPNLVAWTGWYAIARNGLITADIVNLFEYDVNVVGEWLQSQEECGYFMYPSTDEVWWNYGDIRKELQKHINEKYTGNYLLMTSNYTLSADRVQTDVEYIEELNAKHPMAGHIAERICSYYHDYMLFAPNRLTHLYADSHGTQGRGEQYQDIKYKLL